METKDDEVSLDIQAILTAITKHECSLNAEDSCGLNLQHTYLYKANFTKAHLEGANLSWANLSFAKLAEAHLQGAYLDMTNFTAAGLKGAHLEKSKIIFFADFRSATLEEAHFEGADL